MEKLTRELQLQHEKEVSGFTKLLKQAEIDIHSSQLEVSHYKTMCVDQAEQIEMTDKKIESIRAEVTVRDTEISRMQARVSEYEVRIGHLNLEKQDLLDKLGEHDKKYAAYN